MAGEGETIDLTSLFALHYNTSEHGLFEQYCKRYNVRTNGMTFPESPRVIYKQNPLEEVLCQLRFPTILAIKTVDPAAFQNEIRSSYPLYSKEGDDSLLSGVSLGLPKDVANIVSQLPIAKVGEGVTHKFLTENSARFISLSSEFLAVTETDYRRGEEFKGQIKLAVDAVEAQYHPSFYSRIGLRYVDIIDKSKIGLAEATWDSLINPAVVGMLGAADIGDMVQEIRSVVVMELDREVVVGGMVRVRHGIVKGDDDAEAYKIDVDLFTGERSEADDVIGTLDIFNGLAGNLFRWVITDELRDALGPEELT